MPVSFIIALIMLVLLSAPISSSAAESGKDAPKPGQAREEQPQQITILSIIPAQGEPETSVTLSGSGFTNKTVAFLGNSATPTEVLSSKQLAFDIPNLPPGLYALFLRNADGTTSRTYNFNLLPPKPVVYSLSPDSIQYCSPDREREVVITGRNFQERSQVLFDGAAIRGHFNSRESLSFTAPRVAAGLHQVQVKNQGETLSGAQGLFIDGRPEIDSVTAAEEFVNYYNLVIGGRNFQQDSTLVVSEERDPDQTGSQGTIAEVKRLRSGTANASERERLIYVNCGRIIYQRYPYSTTLKNFKVQLVNPGGEESSVVQVSAP
jgi:hypothetical protein